MDVGSVGEFRDDAINWWNMAFHMHRVTSQNRRFGFIIQTNGLGVSVTIKKPRD